MLKFNDLCFFSIYYLGIRNRNSFLLNITAILLSMIIIVATLSYFTYLKNHESETLLNTGDPYIITIEVKNLNKSQLINNCEPNTLKRNIMCATYLYHYFLATLCLLFKSSVHIILRFKVFGSQL